MNPNDINSFPFPPEDFINSFLDLNDMSLT